MLDFRQYVLQLKGTDFDKNDYSHYVWGRHLPLYTNFYANLRILILGVPGGTLIGGPFLRIDKNDYSYYVWGGHLPLYTNFCPNRTILKF